MASKPSFKIFDFIAALNRKDVNAFNKLSDVDKKAAVPFTVYRFLVGTSDKKQLLALNDVNHIALKLDKEIVFPLLASCTSGKVFSVKWMPPLPNSSTDKVQLIAEYYGCSIREAKLMVDTIPDSMIAEMKEQMAVEEPEKKTTTKKRK